MLSCYYTTIGFYFTTMITVWTVYVFLYGRLYLSLGGLHEALATGKRFLYTMHLSKLLSLQSCVQLGFLMALPMMMETGLERGLRAALSEFVLMQLQLASVFFTFSLGTRTHYGTSTAECRCSMEELQSIELLGSNTEELSHTSSQFPCGSWLSHGSLHSGRKNTNKTAAWRSALCCLVL